MLNEEMTFNNDDELFFERKTKLSFRKYPNPNFLFIKSTVNDKKNHIVQSKPQFSAKCVKGDEIFQNIREGKPLETTWQLQATPTTPWRNEQPFHSWEGG